MSSRKKKRRKLNVLGVSVHHLRHVFLEDLCSKADELSVHSKISEIETLQKQPLGLIRKTGENVVCPIDGKLGAAYVHCLNNGGNKIGNDDDDDGVNNDHVGIANYMLSYSWEYSIGDIVDTLFDFCETKSLSPKRTYIWIDCLCINQHRVVAQKEAGGTGLLNFEQEFPVQLKQIGSMLAMMRPWNEPRYLKRIWCIFELYTAHNCGIPITIVMPPREKKALTEDVINQKGGIDMLYKTLGNTKIQDADASIESDKHKLLGIIKSSIGYHILNNRVNDLLRSWMEQTLMGLVATQEDTNDAAYAIFCDQIGLILLSNGDLNDSLKLFQRSSQIHEKIFGWDHPETAGTYRNIGLVKGKRGDYVGAIEQHQKCLAIYEATLGKQHRKTAFTHENIGNAKRQMGDYDSAMKHYQECLSVQEAVLGKNHQETSSTYSNIGMLLEEMRDYNGALGYYQQCMSIRECVLGINHPATAATYNSIGSALDGKGDYDGAVEYYLKCLEVQESVLGKCHPETAATYLNLGTLLYNTDDHKGALDQYMKCLAVQESLLGEDHPDTATTYNNIANVLDDLGDYDGALENYQKCLKVREAVLGKDHPDTIETANNLHSF